MRPTVLLFDIDGTLLSTCGAGRRAFALTFVERFQRPDAIQFSLDGMTDRRICRLALEAIGVDSTPAEIDTTLQIYLKLLVRELEQSPPGTSQLHPGVSDLLVRAAAQPQTVLGLGTGNIREGAELKLSRVDLWQRFSFGGFGSDHEERVELVRIGAGRGAEKLGLPVDQCRVVVIGDTPKDVDAGRAIGAETVGVGTGRFSPRELLDAGATRAFAHLAEPGAADYILRG